MSRSTMGSVSFRSLVYNCNLIYYTFIIYYPLETRMLSSSISFGYHVDILN
jgi:hypothetical protein